MTPRQRFVTILDVVRRPETIAVIVLILIAAFLLKVEQTPDTGESLDSYSSYDTKSGGYHAWYELVGAERLSTSTFERHAVMLDPGLHTLIYAEPVDGDPRAQNPSASDVGDLDTWIRAGGHFVYLGHDDEASSDGDLGLPATVPATPAPKASGAPVAHHGKNKVFDSILDDQARYKKYAVSCTCVVGTLFVAPELRRAGIVRIDPRSDRRLYPTLGKKFTTLVSDAKGPLVVRYARGKGEVTELLDESLFTNARLGNGDDARLAYALAAPGPVAFDEVPHGYLTPEQWYEVVPRPFVIAIGISIVAVLIAIAGASIRLGPPVVPFEREPTSVEFIDSLAGLFQRNHASRAALDDAIVSVRRTVATSLGFTASAAVEDVVARMRNPEDRGDFLELLATTRADRIDDAHLVRALALAQRLRKDYAHARSRN